ncbi:MAG: ATP-dependent DNA helicase RecQ [Spirochaetes bacterium ADurb.Bin110]|nr:MAG: ATP-dependent DNA helicase RecQ [Spirochaetes bacterium ADurb.Bin110]
MLKQDFASEPEDPIGVLGRDRFHIPHLTPLQRFVIANILDEARGSAELDKDPNLDLIVDDATMNQDEKTEFPERQETYRQLILFPTGFGKSVCFQLPSLLLSGLTIVVYPLLALMNDQKRRLDEANIPCALFRGGLSKEEWHEQEELITSGKATMVVVNPEILSAPKLRRFLNRFGIAHFVVDEAHCISEWGESFRPSYLALGEAVEAISPRILSAFTATAGPHIVQSIEKKLFMDKNYQLVDAEADRSNILYAVVHTLSMIRTLRQTLLYCKKPAIIFDRSRPGTRLKAELLKASGFNQVRFYHAGLDRPERCNIEQWFQDSDDAILVSTNAYGMGMDKKNIRTVIHSSLPESAEAYIQEAGRGGRDGKNALAILIDDLAARYSLYCRANQKDDRERDMQSIRKACFLPYPALKSCRREFLLHLLGEQQTPECGKCDNCIEGSHTSKMQLDSDASDISPEWEFLSRAEGFIETISFCASHQGVFTSKELIDILGAYGKGKGKYAGCLYGWLKIEREELINSLFMLDILYAPKKGTWKNRILLSQKGKTLSKLARNSLG